MDMIYVEDCCEILDSMRVPITASDREEGEYPYYGANGIQDHVADYIFDDELVLLAEDGGNFGSKERPIAYRVSGKCWVNNHAHVLKPKAGLDVDYLCYSLMFYKVDGMVNGATRQKLTQAAMRKMKIPSRSMNEQLHIVDELNRILKIKEQRQQELTLLDDLIKARFVELFGEYYMNHINEKQLDEICDFIDYRGKTPEKSESGIPLITAKNVKDNRFSIEPQEFIPEENYDAVMTRGIPRVNDVLFTTEAPLGNVCRIPDVYERFCVGQRLITMQPHTDVINSEYLEHALASAEFQEKMWQKSSGSTVKGIRSKLLVLLTIPVPPIELQNQFRDFVHQVDKSKVVCVFGRLAWTQIKRV